MKDVSNIDLPTQAERMLTRAFELEPQLGHIALYYRAMARVQLGRAISKTKNDGQRKEINNELDMQARNDLNIAIGLTGEMMDYLIGVFAFSNNQPTSALAKQFRTKQLLLNHLQSSCRKAREIIKRRKTDKDLEDYLVKVEGIIPLQSFHRDCLLATHDNEAKMAYKKKMEEVKQSGVQIYCEDALIKALGTPEYYSEKCLLSSFLAEPKVLFEFRQQKLKERQSYADSIIVPWDELEELGDVGLCHHYELGLTPPDQPLWSIYLVAFLGVLQLTVGLLLTCVSGGLAVPFGMAMIFKYK